MSPAATESAVRDYLRAVKDPSSLRDDSSIAGLRKQLEEADDGLERLRLRQQIADAESPNLQRYEEGFVTHAKAWADEIGIGAKAFAEEGVPNDVLRRAGFSVTGRRGRGASKSSGSSGRGPRRSRVTVDQVRAAIPKGGFTIKKLQDLSGASPAVVRKVVVEEEGAGRLVKGGADPDHRGPGRAPVLYRRA